MSDLIDNNLEICRSKYLADKVIFVDGLAGCGKTLFSPIVSSFNRVELLSYAYEIELVCSLFYLNKISKDAAVGMIKILTDLKLYNIMQSRDVNFRISDLSSVWRDANKWRYFRRLFHKGDEHTIKRIRIEKPILSYTSHNILGFSEPIFSGLGNRVLILNILRHPLYMLIQNHLNMERLTVNNPRVFTHTYSYNDHQLYFWTKEWKDLFLKSNEIDKAIYYSVKLTELRNSFIAKNSQYDNQILSIPFETFVLKPQPYLDKLEIFLGIKMSHKTKKVLKIQKVPRKKISDGIPLAIYKRCGWEPPEKAFTEQQELDKRRDYALSQGASKDAMNALDDICQSYEDKLWSP
tara:strand:+ start:341 stop:1390 length:1050 start_codon:yes stop_codon:yes gene_type:complete